MIYNFSFYYTVLLTLDKVLRKAFFLALKMLMGCLSASKEGKLQTRKWCSYRVNVEVEGEAKLQPTVRHALSTGMHPPRSLFIACPKSPRGQNGEEDQDGLQNPMDLVVWVTLAD